MTNKNKSSSTTLATPSYIDFDPTCDLKKEEGVDTLIIQLPGFKKDHLRVQVNNNGDLKVSGEKLSSSSSGKKSSRFVKETKIPEGCDINAIRAKFIKGRLHITLPQKIASSTPSSSLRPQSKAINQKPKLESSSISDIGETKKAITNNTGNIIREGNSGYDQLKWSDHMFEYGRIIQNLQGRKKVVCGFGFAAVTMVAIGAFVASKYGSSSSISSS